MIRIEGLTRYFGNLAVLQGVNLEVAQGECFGLLGPNGAGKTTLINIICGLLPPSSGQVRISGVSVDRHFRAPRVGLGLAPQELSLFSGLTGRENLEFFARIRGENKTDARAETERLLSQVGLAADADRRAGVYSQGMKQKLNMAAALLGDPRLLLLDEPTSGLDPVARIGVWGLVKNMKEAGKTVLLATHNLEEAERLCDRVAILSAGRIKVVGVPADLQASHEAASFEESFIAILEEG